MVKRSILLIKKILQSIREIIELFFKKDIVLMYTMGKVGTTTVEATLKENNVHPVIHIHQLNFNRENDRSKKTLYDLKSYVISIIIKKFKSRKNIKIISAVRDPISRNMSSFFQIINRYDEKTYQMGLDNVEELIDSFFLQYKHDYPLTWFDKELKEVFDFDIYKHSFEKVKGYSIYKKDNLDILLIKTEKIKEIGTEAINDFMNLNISTLVNKNRADNKRYSNLYTKFKNNIQFSQEYINKMYQSKFMNHFYTNEEIENKKYRLCSRN